MRRLKGGGSLPPRPSVGQLLRGLIGGFVGILVLSYLGHATGVPWLVAPFGATCVLLFTASNSPLAQPRNVIGGHLVSSVVGMVALYGFGNSMFVVSLAVGIAIVLMQLFRVVHPPAGADPLVVILAGKTAVGLSFLVTPILVGSVMLVVIAAIINNWGKGGQWPVYWHGIGSDKGE